ncbi:MAG: RNA methyltransferase [Steroidobacteraceae bacterium]
MQFLPVRFVLLDTSHPGNIGAVARAMKNMGLNDLVLVAPRQFPDPEAVARASGADDVLAAARVVPTLADGLAGCGLVFATTARERDQNFRVLDVRAAAARIVATVQDNPQPVAVLFGNERSGLSNEQLAAAHVLLRIPANPEYESLNLAQAAQVIAYEIMMARNLPSRVPAIAPTALAAPEDMERLYEHLQRVLVEIDFRDRTPSGANLMNRIRRFLQRAELDFNEVNILRGILTAVQSKRRIAGSPRDE